MINVVEFRPHHGVPRDQVWPLLDAPSRSFVLRSRWALYLSLAPLRDHRFHTIVAQPGFSQGQATDEHLRVIAGAESYVRAVTGGSFDFYCQK
jgi:hypothetical protein